jgi:hypothetical protein
MQNRCAFLAAVGAAGLCSVAGCGSRSNDNPRTESSTPSEAAVAAYYEAAAAGDPERAAGVVGTPRNGGHGQYRRPSDSDAG